MPAVLLGFRFPFSDIGGLQFIPVNRQPVWATTNLAVFHVSLGLPRAGVYKNSVFLQAKSADKVGIHAIFSPALGWMK